MRSIFNPFSILFSIVLVVVLVGVAEWLARRNFSLESEMNKNYLQILALEKIPNRAGWLKQLVSQGSPAPQKYYDFHVHAFKPFSQPDLGFSDYFSARRTPASTPLGASKSIVWLFGGSTLQNLDTPDSLTIVNQFALNLKNAGKKVTVQNFGVGGFPISMELTKFADLLRRVPANERPQTVVFYDGFNEMGCGLYNGAGNLSGSLRSKMTTMVEGNYGRLALYGASNWLKTKSILWRKHFATKMEYRIFDYLKKDSTLSQPKNFDKTVSIYIENTKMIEAICGVYQIKPFFILQPMIHTKKPLTAFELGIYNALEKDWKVFAANFYKELPTKMQGNANFYDISTVLNNRTHNDFFDEGHTAPYTPRIIGKKIFDIVNQSVE